MIPRKSLGYCVSHQTSADDVRRPRRLFVASDYRNHGRPGPLMTGRVSRVIEAMHFLLSCWFWFARRARRRATGRSVSAGRAVRGRSGAQRNAGREPWPQRATRGAARSAELPARGCSRSAQPERSPTAERSRQSGATPPASVQAFLSVAMLVTARSATPRQAGASARAPRAPGQADPAEATKAEATGAEPLAEQRERARRPAAAASSVSDCRGSCGG